MKDCRDSVYTEFNHFTLTKAYHFERWPRTAAGLFTLGKLRFYDSADFPDSVVKELTETGMLREATDLELSLFG